MASSSYKYPLTKMNFVVSIDKGTAAFNEVTGVDATVDVIEFRQGNFNSLAPVKLPGLVKHGNVTLKMGYTTSNDFRQWIEDCVNSERTKAIERKDVSIELLNSDTLGGAISSSDIVPKAKGPITWVLKGAFVTKYQAPDLNALQSEVAIETLEIAYETLTMPGSSGGAAS